MMGDGFRRAQAGEKLQLSAAAWNACLDAADAHRTGKNRNRGPENRQFRQADIVLVSNLADGSDVPRFGILGIENPIIAPPDNLDSFQSEVAIRGRTPTANYRGKFVICLEPIATGQIGRAWISGVCQVQVDITNDKHLYCDVKQGDLSKLQSGEYGSARILYREGTGTGTKWCIVRLGDAGQPWPIRVGKVAADWLFGTCASVSVWENTAQGGCLPSQGVGAGEFSGVPQANTQTIQNVANLSRDVAADSWVVIGKAANDRWYLLEAGKDQGSCRTTIGGEDITKWPGWDGTKVQLLGHSASGCLQWFDAEECSTGGTGGTGGSTQ